jgi:hypothetical protein
MSCVSCLFKSEAIEYKQQSFRAPFFELARLARPPQSSGGQNRKFPYCLKSGGGLGGAAKKMIRKFYGFAFGASLLQKGLINNIAQVQHTALSSVVCADPRRYARGKLSVRSLTRNASDWHSLSLVSLVSVLVARSLPPIKVLWYLCGKKKGLCYHATDSTSK